MTDETMQNDTQELEEAKARATELGIEFRSNISLTTLLDRIAAKEAAAPDVTETAEEGVAAMTEEVVAKKPLSRKEAREAAMKLVRFRVTCMNPQKKNLESELFTAGNSVVPTVTKLVKFETEWHAPQIIFNMIKRRKFRTFVTKKNPENGQTYKEPKLIPEYAIEVLDPLTESELKALAQRQAMAAGTDE